MAQSGKSVFNNPFLSTKVKSANVKIVPEALLGYLVGPFCGLLANSLFGTLLVAYFQDVLFAEELAAGNTGVQTFLTIFPMLSAILIVAGNLFAGQIIERTRSRAGKARPYILLSSVVLAVASVLMFIQPMPENTTFKMVWLAIAYNLFYAVAFPLYNTANSALVPVSTRNGKQRGLLASLVNMATLGGAGAGSIIFPQILLALTGGFPNDHSTELPNANGYLVMFIAIGIITFIGCLAQYYFTRERVTEESMIQAVAASASEGSEKAKGPSIGKQAKALFSDKFFVVTIIFYLLYQLSGGIKNASMQNFTNNVVFEGFSGAAAMSVLGIVGAVPMAVAMAFIWPLSRKFSKRLVVMFGLLIGAVGGVIAGIWANNIIAVCIGVALKSFGSAPACYMILAMISDVLDHLEAKHGFRCDGLTMSIYSSIMAATTPLAQSFFNAVTNGGANGTMVTVSYIWIETGVYVACAILMIFFVVEKYLKDDRAKILERQKAEALAAGIEWVEPEVRLAREQAEAERLSEEARVMELKAYCEKKGLSFEEEEAKYQAKQEEKRRKAEAKKAAKAAKKSGNKEGE